MPEVNTHDRIMKAALQLFLEKGFQKTSIGAIEKAAGLVPRAGAFYRHFDGKQALLMEIARSYASNTNEDFGLDKLSAYGDTRAELIAIALKYEEAAEQQKPYLRLIEEIRLLDFGDEIQGDMDSQMMIGLASWGGSKPAAKHMSQKQLSALLVNIIGGWVFYMMKKEQDGMDKILDRDTMLNEWATRWATFLDSEN